MTTQIITLNEKNLAQYGCPCFLNPQNKAHIQKCTWVRNQWKNGLVIKHLVQDQNPKPIGFIEYIEGDQAWRAVDVAGYYFVHCIWISPNKVKNQGFGSLLIQDCVKHARRQGKKGVAVVTGDQSFIADQNVFIKNGFRVVDSRNTLNLLVLAFDPITLTNSPKFKPPANLARYTGFHIFYSEQCPWVIRSIDSMMEELHHLGIQGNLTKLETPQQVQAGPSIYATFTLVYNGQILVDHYVSLTRFKTIINNAIQQKVTSKNTAKRTKKTMKK